MAHGVTPDALRAALAAAPDARAAFVVSPTYYGMAPTSRAAPRSRTRRTPRSSSTRRGGRTSASTPACPRSALELGRRRGADLDAQDRRRADPVGDAPRRRHDGRVDPGGIARAVRLVRSTSPSSLLLASLDAARRQLAMHGEGLLVADARRGRPGARGDRRDRRLPRGRRRGVRRARRRRRVGPAADRHRRARDRLHRLRGRRPRCAAATTSTSSSRPTRRSCSCSGSPSRVEPLERFAHDLAAEPSSVCARRAAADALAAAGRVRARGRRAAPREAFLGASRASSPSTTRSGAISCRGDRRLPAGDPRAAARRAGHRRGRRLPARARRVRAPACTARATQLRDDPRAGRCGDGFEALVARGARRGRRRRAT